LPYEKSIEQKINNASRRFIYEMVGYEKLKDGKKKKIFEVTLNKTDNR